MAGQAGGQPSGAGQAGLSSDEYIRLHIRMHSATKPGNPDSQGKIRLVTAGVLKLVVFHLFAFGPPLPGQAGIPETSPPDAGDDGCRSSRCELPGHEGGLSPAMQPGFFHIFDPRKARARRMGSGSTGSSGPMFCTPHSGMCSAVFGSVGMRA